MLENIYKEHWDIIKDWNFLPIRSKSNDWNINKSPALKSWKELQRKKFPLNLLEMHLSREGNVGVICGKISNNLIIIDLDVKNEELGSTVPLILDQHFPNKDLLNTLIQKTASGGYHLFYYWKGDNTPTNESHKNIFINPKTKLFEGLTVTSYSPLFKGFDVRGEGGYAVIPPSKNYGKKEYVFINSNKIRSLNKDEFNIIKAFFIKEKSSKPRQGFIDILNGKIEIHEQTVFANDSLRQKGIDKNLEEHVYWRSLFRELFHNCGIDPAEVFELLKKNQPHFDEKKTLTQLKYEYNSPLGKPLSNEVYFEYFPQYKKEKNEFDNVLESEEIKEPGELKYIAFQNGIIKKTDKNIEYGIFKRLKNGEEVWKGKETLNGNLKLLHKTKDIKGKNEEKFTFLFNDDLFNTTGVEDILKYLKPYIFSGGLGVDVLKKYIIEASKDIEFYKPSYYLGYGRKGWRLPQLEKELKFVNLSFTQYQQNIHKNIAKNVKIYSDDEKKKIKELMQNLIKRTQLNENVLSVIIGWSTASVFRSELIYYLKIFPILYLIGKYEKGKTSALDTFVTNFYQAWDNHLSGSAIDTLARLEDILSTSTFPIVIDELEKIRQECIPVIKEHTTGDSDYMRKDGLVRVIQRPKTAPLAICSNDLMEEFKSEAMNTKMIVLNFDEEIVEKDEEWIRIANELKKYNPFSLLFETTIGMKRDTFKIILDRVKESYKNTFEQFGDNEYSRLPAIHHALMFGVVMFNTVFDMELKCNFKELLIKERRETHREICDDFRDFCLKAINFDEGFVDERGFRRRGDNPKYLTSKLVQRPNGDFIFTSDNKRDFCERIGRRLSLEKIKNLVAESLEDKKLITCGILTPPGKSRTGRVIIIKENFLF